MSDPNMPLIQTFFTVGIDGVNLGAWTGLSGISMSIGSDPHLDSGVSTFQNHLPGPMSYEPITLTRAANSFTAATMAWFSAYHLLPVPMTAEIVAYYQGTDLMRWDLIGVTPFKWTGPSFKIGATEHSSETLVLNHWGFI